MDAKRKVLVSDYDQTFFIDEESLKLNMQAVAEFRKQENIFVIATGRSYLDFHNKLDMYHFDYDYVIINHGATILDAKNQVFINYHIDNNIINNIKNDLRLDKSISNFCCSELDSRVSFEHKNLTKIHVKYNSKEEAMDVNKIINDKYHDYVNSYYVTENSVEIISKEIDKSKAINILVEKLKIDKDDVYTIGDGYSDIKMIEDYKGYAIKNSVDELKKVAIKEVSNVSDLIEEIM